VSGGYFALAFVVLPAVGGIVIPYARSRAQQRRLVVVRPRRCSPAELHAALDGMGAAVDEIWR
jgi:hypothetical protein